MSSFYALTARLDGEKERTCALLPSSSIDGAERAAREMRHSGALGYVEPGSRFRIRRATRTEISLMRRFLHSCHLEAPADRTGADFDSLIVRRQRLLLSFFLGLYFDPVGMRARLSGVADPSTPGGGVSGSGGIERATPEAADERPAGSMASESPQDAAEGKVSTGDGPIGAESQEAALAGILASPEANDGGAGRDGGYDLEDLF